MGVGGSKQMCQAEELKVAPDEAPVPCIHSYKAVNCGGGGGGGGWWLTGAYQKLQGALAWSL